MPWTIWTIVALIFLVLDTLMRYVRLRATTSRYS